jgi:CDP-4-dehydro-6-deoxyglucose reductase
MDTLDPSPSYLCALEPDGRCFATDGRGPLLDAALAAGIAVPFSCRRGECGSCRAQVLGGSHQRIAPPSAAGYAVGEQELLLCQCRATSDLRLRFAHWQAPVRPPARRSVQVASIGYLARDVVRLVVDVQGGEPFDWMAGQHVQVLADGGVRCFSIANAPGETRNGRLEFHIRRVPGGAFTDRVLGRLAPGDVLEIDGPHGGCTWPAPSSRGAGELVLLATGTGLAGVRPVLVAALEAAAFSRVTLYWGHRDADDGYAAVWLDELQAHHAGFRWQAVLSNAPRAQGAAPMRVQHAALAAGHAWPQALVYACGNPAMVRESRDALQAAGVVPERFFSEAFVPAVPAAPRHPWEQVGARFSLQGILQARRRSIDAVEAIAAQMRPGMSAGELAAQADATLQAMGAAYNWHPTYVRFGPDTQNTWHQPVNRSRTLRDDDIVVIDIGPVWDGYEGDYGDTFVVGDGAAHRRCAAAAREIFGLAREAWLGGITGQALYAHAEALARARGYELVGNVPGHRVSEFPHALYGKHRLADADFVPGDGIWVLEIQLRDPERGIGAFFEDVLLRG